MEVPITLTILADQFNIERIDAMKVITYLSEVGTIIFDEQLDSLDVGLSKEALNGFKLFSQKHSDFFTCMDSLEESESSITAIFIVGWGSECCVKSLKKIFAQTKLKVKVDLKKR